MKLKQLFLVGGLLMATALPCQAALVAFVSGNGFDTGNEAVLGQGEVWGTDSLVRFKPYGNADQANIPTEADFKAISDFQNYYAASLPATIAPTDTNGWAPLSNYVEALPVFNFASKNIFGQPGASALFGIPIDVPQMNVHGCKLVFYFSVDNYLGFVDESGETVAEGLYWNGTPLEGTARYNPEERFMSGSIITDIPTDLVNPGETNWLYMNVTDHVPSAGIVFAGTIDVTNPEPATILIWSLLGFVGVGVAWKKRRK